MLTDGFEPVVRMATAFGLVASGAIPVGLLGWRFGRRAVPQPLPTPTADDPAFAFGYLLVFAAHLVGTTVLGQVADATGLPQRVAATTDAELLSVWRSVFGSLLATPIVVTVWVWFRASTRTTGVWRAAGVAVAVGVLGWVTASPAVYALNGASDWVSTAMGVPAQEHPLVKAVSSADAGQAVLLFAAVAVATPFAEEVVFRGLLLGWLTRRPEWAAVPVGVAGLLTAGSTSGVTRVLALGFLSIIVVGLVLVRHRPAVVAVGATAALFALVHASVWPTPVPLFLLGLVLGAVTVRTGGVLAGTVLHGLFNAVSLVYLLRR